MHIVKHDAITSTNEVIKDLLEQKKLPSWTVVTAEFQYKGRGQVTTDWVSDRSKNLLISVYLEFDDFAVSDSFNLICAASLAVYKTLEVYDLPFLKVKWPNDILTDGRKIAGILIENTFVGNRIKNTIIGIGMNINQDSFPEFLPQAVSLKMIKGIEYNRDQVLGALLENLRKHIHLLNEKQYSILKKSYEKHLYRIHEKSLFQDESGNEFSGKIIGVSKDGKLIVETENADLKLFAFKQIRFL